MRIHAASEHERDAERKRLVRHDAAEIAIPFPSDVALRKACLADWRTFLRVCFPHVFFQGFTPARVEMAEAIRFAAVHGGDQAIAGPRGEGKTRYALFVLLWLLLRRDLSFAVLIAKNGPAAIECMDALKFELEQNDDGPIGDLFPEVVTPIRELGGWASRAKKQHVRGRKTHVVWSKPLVAFPSVAVETLEEIDRRWREVGSCAAGQAIGCVGIEGRIRGWSFRSRRPTLAVIDDVDDRESAKSDTQIEDRCKTIDADIAGLAGPRQRTARVMLCTLINRKCVAAIYTDPKQRPSFKGKRLKALVSPPDREDLWEDYVDRRRSGMEGGGDPLGRKATDLYLAHRKAMDAGAVMGNPERFDGTVAEDGRPLQVSALQAFFDDVADKGWDAVNTEYQQEPPDEGGPESDDLTPTVIRSRLSHLPQREVPGDATTLTAFVDLGKRRLHWCVTAWAPGAIGTVIDYGEKPTSEPDAVGAERAIRLALDELADELLGLADDGPGPYCRPDGEVVEVEAVLVDSGNWNTVVYQFCRERGAPFHPSMGDPKFHAVRQRTRDKKPGGDGWYWSRQGPGLWVVNMHADWWKLWLHERLRTEPFDDGARRRGSLALFGSEPKTHAAFASQLMAERYVREFVEGKGWVEKWQTFSRDNHYLDCLYGCCVAANMRGVTLLGGSKSQPARRAPAAGGKGWFASQVGR